MLSVNGAPAGSLTWIEEWTFRRTGNTGLAAELRYNVGPGGCYILKRQ